jgi:predicted DNA-binding protein
MDTRARFEEIWPVPEQIQWSADRCAYWTEQYGFMLFAAELNLRLDTFTRCQETTDVYVSLIIELVKEVEDAYSAYGVMPECVDRAKQIIGREK